MSECECGRPSFALGACQRCWYLDTGLSTPARSWRCAAASAAVVSELRDGPADSLAELAHRLGRHPEAVGRTLKRLLDSGRVLRVQGRLSLNERSPWHGAN